MREVDQEIYLPLSFKARHLIAMKEQYLQLQGLVR